MGAMNEENERTKRFGFTQFRFVVAGILFLAAGLKAYQLATAPLPPVVQGSAFTPLLELLNDRYFLMAVVVGEILFALILVAGIWRQWTWLLSLLGFTAFTLVSMMKGLSGESSCGCFGTVTVNPWITMCFDLVIVAHLAVFRERLDWTFPPLDRKKMLAVLIAWFILAGLALFGMLSLKQQPHATLGTEFTGSDGKRMILLEPETWIGKEFPLVSRFVQPEGAEVLQRGTWNVLFIHTDCKKCQELMAELENRKAKNVAIIVVPTRPNERISATSFPTFWLDEQNDWFVTTPCVVKLSKGICVEIGEGVVE
jgi:hypothetical protein